MDIKDIYSQIPTIDAKVTYQGKPYVVVQTACYQDREGVLVTVDILAITDNGDDAGQAVIRVDLGDLDS